MNYAVFIVVVVAFLGSIVIGRKIVLRERRGQTENRFWATIQILLFMVSFVIWLPILLIIMIVDPHARVLKGINDFLDRHSF